MIAGTVCAYPKFTPVPFNEDDLWNGYPGGDERALRRREEGAARRAHRPTASSTACDAIYLLPANLYGPRDNFDLETTRT